MLHSTDNKFNLNKRHVPSSYMEEHVMIKWKQSKDMKISYNNTHTDPDDS